MTQMKRNVEEDALETQNKYDEMMEEMEKDMEVFDYSIPKDWDIEFRATIKNTLRSEAQKRRKRIIRRASAIACIVFFLMIGTLASVEKVQGFSIKELFQKVFHIENDTYILSSLDSDIEFEDSDMREIVFKGKNLDDVMTEVRDELKRPIFYFEDIFNDYTIQKANYNEDFDVLSIELIIADKVVYITQESVHNISGIGDIAEKEECYRVYNENIEKNITIYTSKERDEYWFNVQEQETYFSFIGNVSLKECKKLAQSLYFQ